MFEELYRKLKSHDWFFRYSESYDVFCAGTTQRLILRALISKCKKEDQAKTVKIVLDFVAGHTVDGARKEMKWASDLAER